MNTVLYSGVVRHSRTRPVEHQLKYRVFYGLWDVDELDQVAGRTRLFSVDRFNVTSLRRSDYGDGTGNLRGWAERLFEVAGLDRPPDRIALLSHPRVFGYAFNPISVWYAFGIGGELVGIIHEVRNTFGDKHSYAMVLSEADTGHSFEKKLHVSPFNDMESTYTFRLNSPSSRLTFSIAQADRQGVFLRAGLGLSRRPLSDRHIVNLLFTHPLLTFKVIAGIHWEALKLWRKGAKFYRRPDPPPSAYTTGREEGADR